MNLLRPSVWTMRVRIALALALVAVAMLPVNLLAVGSYRRLLERVDLLTDVEAAQLRAVNEIAARLARVRAQRRSFFRTGQVADLEAARDGLEGAVDQARLALRLSDRERQAFGRVGQTLVQYRQVLDDAEALALSKGQHPDEPATVLAGELAVREHHLEELAVSAEDQLTAIADRTWGALAAGRTRAAAAAGRSLRNLVTGLLVTALVVVLLTFWLPAVATRPLLRLRTLVRRVEREELDQLEPGGFPPGESRRLAEALAVTLRRRRDIQRLQKQRIRVLENRFRRLLDSIDEPVLVIGREGKVAVCGRRAAALLARPARALEGHDLTELLPGAELSDLLERLLSGPVDESGPETVATTLPIGAPISVRVEPLRDDSGAMRQGLVFLRPAAEQARKSEIS